MALLGEARVTDGCPLLADLEADEPRLRGRQRALAQEPGLRARADLELELGAGDDRAKIDAVHPWGKTRGVLVGARLALRRVSGLGGSFGQ
jgi:hypothetical protein